MFPQIRAVKVRLCVAGQSGGKENLLRRVEDGAGRETAIFRANAYLFQHGCGDECPAPPACSSVFSLRLHSGRFPLLESRGHLARCAEHGRPPSSVRAQVKLHVALSSGGGDEKLCCVIAPQFGTEYTAAALRVYLGRRVARCSELQPFSCEPEAVRVRGLYCLPVPFVRDALSLWYRVGGYNCLHASYFITFGTLMQVCIFCPAKNDCKNADIC